MNYKKLRTNEMIKKFFISCIIIMLLLFTIIFSGCKVNNSTTNTFSSANTVISDCMKICKSHSWFYEKEYRPGWGRTVCYCTDENGAIWPFNI